MYCVAKLTGERQDGGRHGRFREYVCVAVALPLYIMNVWLRLHAIISCLCMYVHDAAVVKVIVIGEGRVGKSSMTQRYCRGVYTDTYKKTIGVDFLEKQIELEDIGEEVKLMIWDTAGQEEFDSLTKGYYRGAGAVVLVFSTVDRDSFERIPRWLEKAKTECGMVPMALVQNKCDLEDSAAVSKYVSPNRLWFVPLDRYGDYE